MIEVILTCPTEEGSQEVALETDRISFGRGSEAEYRFDDDGLSRLHASVYRENDYVWVVDENSTNGTFVNGEKVSPSGTPLRDGDVIKIGHYTNLKVRISEKQTAVSSASSDTPPPSSVSISAAENPFGILPLVVIAFALFLIGGSLVVIGVKVFGNNQPEIVDNFDTPISDLDNDKDNGKKETPTPTPETKQTAGVNSSPDNTNLTNSPEIRQSPTEINLPSGKKYTDMTDSEKRQYLEVRAQKVAAMIGNRTSGAIPPLAIDNIKRFLDGYVSRLRAGRVDNCSPGGWVRSDMATVLERASKNAPFIIQAFNAQGIDPQIGIYLAMIESEHCVCLQSPTGPLGMFQFTKATGETYGLQTFRGASPDNPDERCKPEPAAKAAGRYMKFLTGRFGTGPSSVPLAIGSYNSGEGGLSKNLATALESNEGLPRDFWTLIANGDKLSKQFQSENFKYVPKFFAAAIIGENPQDFGLKLQPLSTYTK